MRLEESGKFGPNRIFPQLVRSNDMKEQFLPLVSNSDTIRRVQSKLLVTESFILHYDLLHMNMILQMNKILAVGL